ncbi:hypothetical protein BO224_09895 [Erysipelotrichaceae bacterium NYU-BL-E8]|uniref:Uncharacterized protein n=1 Tax=Ileibacterium valens TaxID=1862668 RepID=A0A1U7NES4_9FIRM|nr:hypothetical protein BO224_09895 [Erysipelotrichaceae bacterium NYU-BL-E8]OLU38170.1 hypothetical protein BO222_08860 [Ileibacterium valens]OLU38415.1 hypothetical protein BM735_09390 [Erysipelotrichaceae bacterium NYU-BL-F16]
MTFDHSFILDIIRSRLFSINMSYKDKYSLVSEKKAELPEKNHSENSALICVFDSGYFEAIKSINRIVFLN